LSTHRYLSPPSSSSASRPSFQTVTLPSEYRAPEAVTWRVRRRTSRSSSSAASPPSTGTSTKAGASGQSHAGPSRAVERAGRRGALDRPGQSNPHAIGRVDQKERAVLLAERRHRGEGSQEQALLAHHGTRTGPPGAADRAAPQRGARQLDGGEVMITPRRADGAPVALGREGRPGGL